MASSYSCLRSATRHLGLVSMWFYFFIFYYYFVFLFCFVLFLLPLPTFAQAVWKAGVAGALPCHTLGAAARAGGDAGVGSGAGIAAILLPFMSHFSCTLAPRVKGESPLCALLISESKYNTSRGRALPLLVLVRPGAAARSALLKLLPLAPGSCRPQGAHTSALGSVPPAERVAPAASIRGAGLGSGAEEPPPAPVFASLPGGAGPGPDLSWHSAGA